MLRRVPGLDEELPRTFLRDPKELRAIAHPARIRLLEELAFDGPLTATELADRIGESPANCSWHLRQLQRYGFVEEAGGGRGRQRPWQMVVRANSWGEAGSSPEMAVAEQVASEVLVAHEVEALRTALAALPLESAEWHEATFLSQNLVWLTAAELSGINDEIRSIFLRHFNRMSEPARRPADARPVRLVAWGVSARPTRSEKGAPHA
jgi:DNA-binding transcriptional ArsR family regulator